MRLGQLVISAEVLALPHLTFIEKAVLAAINQCSLANEPFNQSHFAKEAGISRRSVSGAVRVLKASGHCAEIAHQSSLEVSKIFSVADNCAEFAQLPSLEVSKNCAVSPGFEDSEKKKKVSSSSSPIPPSSSYSNKKKLSPPIPPQNLELPDWVPANWSDFLEHRHRKDRKPMTIAAQKIAIKKLDALRPIYDPAYVLEEAILRNWSGIFDPGPANAKGGKGNGHGKLPMTRVAQENERMFGAYKADPKYQLTKEQIDSWNLENPDDPYDENGKRVKCQKQS